MCMQASVDQAFITYEEIVPDMLAGVISKSDCAKEESKELTPEEAQCKRNPDGTPKLDRDCGFRRVGDLITTIPYSWPVNPNMPKDVKHALSWSIIDRLQQGVMKRRVQQSKAWWPNSPQCFEKSNKAGDGDGIPVSDLMGSTVVALIFILLGVLISKKDLLPRLRCGLYYCLTPPSPHGTQPSTHVTLSSRVRHAQYLNELDLARPANDKKAPDAEPGALQTDVEMLRMLLKQAEARSFSEEEAATAMLDELIDAP